MSRNTPLGGPVDYSAILAQLRTRAVTAEAEVKRLTRERLRQAEERLAAIGALHRRGVRESRERWCNECGLSWPCATWKSLEVP
jgi:hypothetical protein